MTKPRLQFNIARLLAATAGIAFTFWLALILIRTYDLRGPILWMVVTCLAASLVAEAITGDWASFFSICYVVFPMAVAAIYSPLAAVATLAFCLASGFAIERWRGTTNMFSRSQEGRD